MMPFLVNNATLYLINVERGFVNVTNHFEKTDLLERVQYTQKEIYSVHVHKHSHYSPLKTLFAILTPNIHVHCVQTHTPQARSWREEGRAGGRERERERKVEKEKRITGEASNHDSGQVQSALNTTLVALL